MHSKVFQPRVAAREQHLFRNHQAASREQKESPDFSDAVDGKPAEEVDGEIAVVMYRYEGAEWQALVEGEHHGRDANAHAETEGQDSNQRIVIEQDAGEEPERLHKPWPGREDLPIEEI